MTDHNNLRYYRDAHKINRRVARYLTDLAKFNFILVHKPGVSNKADGLSRPPGVENGENDNEDVQVLPDHLFARALITTNLDDEVWYQQSRHMNQIHEWSTKYAFEEIDHRWFYKARPVVPDSDELRRSLL